MSIRRAVQTALVVGIITVALASAALASAARTFVASTGNDANTASSCPLGSPCRSFTAAYSVTSSGGEIVALDSAGYGELLITGPVSIVGAVVASITVTANSTGITINAGASDTIILRNLLINGGNAVNSVGISIAPNGGHLILQNSTLKLLSTGLSVTSAKVDVVNSDILGNGTGIVTNGSGVNPNNNTGPNTGLTEIRISGGNIIGNVTGWTMNNVGNPNASTQNNLTFWYNGATIPNVVGNTTLFSVPGNSCVGANNCVGNLQYTFSNGSSFQ